MSGGTGAARAIVQPSPVIPPELRRHALALEAVVRFTIATDGNATADLEEATPDPQINRILLDTFRRWRFFPALREGEPIASTLVLRVPIRVE
ncbi:MAG TPA: TonB family protein [Telmatospirillum sp.]|nr:TonB family protein [Telmatospirillum sp.]